METWKLWNLETWKLRHLETGKLRSLETWKLGNMETWKLGNLELGNLGNWEIGNLGTWELGNLGTWHCYESAINKSPAHPSTVVSFESATNISTNKLYLRESCAPELNILQGECELATSHKYITSSIFSPAFTRDPWDPWMSLSIFYKQMPQPVSEETISIVSVAIAYTAYSL